MAYEVTATRRRPQTLQDLIGQEFVAATLKNSIESGKIAHAYLFSGPRGCGKTSTARILAKALNCKNGPTATPCGQCSTCQEITKGSSLDVIEIDGASNTSVNDVRQIKDEVMFPPNSCSYKIYIIDEVHMLSTSAFNALLKTIEEPPPYVIFIFATTELQKVPATIKSRCQQFNFRLVPIEKVKEQLALAAKEIQIEADDEALYWIARESTGSMRDAYTLFDQVAAFSDTHITYEKIRDKLGLVGTERLNDIFEECVSKNSNGVVEKLDNFLQSGISIEQLITNSADYLRSLLLIKNGISKEALLGQAAERFSQKVLDAWNSIQIERALSLFLTLYREIRYSLSPRYEIELIFSKLCWLSEYVSPAEVKKAIDNAQNLLMQGAQPVQQQTQTSSVTQSMQNLQQNNQSFAMLNNLANGISKNSEQPNSFYNGGAEPPKNSAASTTENAALNNSSLQMQPQNDAIGVSMEAVKAKVIAATSIDDAFISAGLMQTSQWNFDGTTVQTSIESAFQKSQLEAKSNDIAEHISNILGQKVVFKIIQQEKEIQQQHQQEQIPDNVNIIAKAFKGTIL